MRRLATKSTLFRLIEAGHLARRALVAPLGPLGLLPGDELVLYALNEAGKTAPNNRPARALADLAAESGLNDEKFAAIVRRMAGLGLVAPAPGKNADEIELMLTPKGANIARGLLDHWQMLEERIIGELGRKKTRHLKKALKSVRGSIG